MTIYSAVKKILTQISSFLSILGNATIIAEGT